MLFPVPSNIYTNSVYSKIKCSHMVCYTSEHDNGDYTAVGVLSLTCDNSHTMCSFSGTVMHCMN